MKEIPKNRHCLKCGSYVTYETKIKKYAKWHIYKDGFVCASCYNNLYYPKWYEENHKRIKAIQRDYYYRVVKPKLQQAKKQKRELLA